jgi:mRNA interferase MazF
VVRRGEVYWHNFGRPDKRRPVLVLTRTALLGHLGTVTVAALTRTIRDVASEVVVGPEHGLPELCAVNMHHVFTLRRTEVERFVAVLPPEVMARVDRALVFALGVGESGGIAA